MVFLSLILSRVILLIVVFKHYAVQQFESGYQGAMMSALLRTSFMPIMYSWWLILEMTPAISQRLKDLLLPLDLKIMQDVDIPWGRVQTATVSPEWSGKSFFTRLSNLGILTSESISDWESFLQSLAYQSAIEMMTSLNRLSGVGFLTLTPYGLVKQTEVLFTSSATLTNLYTLWLFSSAMIAQQC